VVNQQQFALRFNGISKVYLFEKCIFSRQVGWDPLTLPVVFADTQATSQDWLVNYLCSSPKYCTICIRQMRFAARLNCDLQMKAALRQFLTSDNNNKNMNSGKFRSETWTSENFFQAEPKIFFPGLGQQRWKFILPTAKLWVKNISTQSQ